MNGKLKTLPVILACFLGIGWAFADSGTRAVETTRTIHASPDDVLRAFLDDGDLRGWWQVSRSLVEPRQDGIWSITWDNWGEEKSHHAWTGVIEDLTADRLLIGQLVMNEPDMPLFGPMQLEIRVEPADGGTSLTVTHRGYGYGGAWDRIYELVVSGWDHVLGDMETWVREAY